MASAQIIGQDQDFEKVARLLNVQIEEAATRTTGYPVGNFYIRASDGHLMHNKGSSAAPNWMDNSAVQGIIAGNGLLVTNPTTAESFTIAADFETEVANLSALGTTASLGVSNKLLRADTRFAHGNLSGGTLHAVATTGTAGFMSSADKTKLDGIAAGAQVNQNAFSTMTGDSGSATAGAPTDSFKIEGSTYIDTVTSDVAGAAKTIVSFDATAFVTSTIASESFILNQDSVTQVGRFDIDGTGSMGFLVSGGGQFSGAVTFNDRIIQSETFTTNLIGIESVYTWNNAAIAFKGWSLNIVDTASSASSLLLNLAVGGAAKFKVDKSGNTTSTGRAIITRGTITADSPSITITETRNNGAVLFNGIYYDVTNTASVSGSLFIQLLENSVPKWEVTTDGDMAGRNAGFSGTLNVNDTLTVGNIAALGSAASTFLTHTAGLVQSRTAAQVLSDIGAAPASGSTSYIHNNTVQQASANYNIDGNGVIGGHLTVQTVKIWRGNSSVATNIAIGIEALMSNTIGASSTAVGYQALRDNTDGTYNTAFGYGTLKLNTTGVLNTALGAQALFKNTTGSYNLGVGVEALQNNLTGSNNTAVGPYDAMFTNTTGASNTALGYAVMYFNDSGSLNTAIGRDALYNNVSANNNVAVGYAAAQLGTGADNTNIGTIAGRDNVSGIRNVNLGSNAGKLSLGSRNINIGYNANSEVLGGSDQLNIGDTYFGNMGTWNDVGTVFTAFKIKVTDTASSALSLLLDAQVGGLSKFSVNKLGELVSTGATVNGILDVSDVATFTKTEGATTATSYLNVISGARPFDIAEFTVEDTTLKAQVIVNSQGLNLSTVFNAADGENRLDYYKARFTGTPATLAAVQSNDLINKTLHRGYDGSAYVVGAEMRVFVDGAVSAGSVPMGFSWWTRAAGGSVTSKMTLSSGGRFLVGSTVDDGVNALQITGSGIFTGSLTASIAALGSAASTFLTHTAGLVQSRTAAQVLSDIGATGTSRTLTMTGTANQVILSAGAQDLSADRTWTFSLPQSIATTSNVTFNNIIASGTLTVSTAGSTFAGGGSGTPAAIFGNTTGTSVVRIRGGAGSSRAIFFATGDTTRMEAILDNTAESGSNAGSNYHLRRYSDAGALLATGLFIRRSDGQVGINNTAPSFMLDVTGTGRYTGALTLDSTLAVTGVSTFTGRADHAGGMTVGGGGTITKILFGSATLDFPNTLAGAASDLTITVTGAAVGDTCSVGVPSGSMPAGADDAWYVPFVSAADTVTVRFKNMNAVTAINPASGTFTVFVFKTT